ncbi:MAG: phosphatidate cytidylyltransferase [Oscillospiraceae bacterium]|nr:phosphatidate cytidylyltransferase [Oscillospiraceae bacterium]
MKERIIVAAVCIPFLFIILFFLPSYIFAALVSIVCAICAYELYNSIMGDGNTRICVYSTFSATLIPIGTYFDVGDLVFQAVVLVLMSLLFIESIIVFRSKKQIPFVRIVISLFGGALIPLMLSSLVALKTMPEGRLFVLLPVISAFITDAGAYFVGKFLGKRRAFPLISPKKTVEGFIGGLAAGVVSMVVYGVILVFTTFHGVIFWAFILYGLVGGAFTELGDLAFSLVKREYNIKDYGRLLPGHGGMLDRFDSMVFTAPAIYLLTLVMPAIVIRG